MYTYETLEARAQAEWLYVLKHSLYWLCADGAWLIHATEPARTAT
jgi:hypothetical protein